MAQVRQRGEETVGHSQNSEVHLIESFAVNILLPDSKFAAPPYCLTVCTNLLRPPVTAHKYGADRR